MPSKLEQMQQQLRQKLMQEKEEKLIKIYNNNQNKVLNKLSKSNELPQKNSEPPKSSSSSQLVEKSFPVSVASPSSRNLPVKKGSPGVDRSRPLVPIRKLHLVSNTLPTIQNSAKAMDAGKKNVKSQANIDEYKKMRAEIKQKESNLVARIKERQIELQNSENKKKDILEHTSKVKVSRTSPIKSVSKENSFGSSKLMPSTLLISNKKTSSINSDVAYKAKVLSAAPPNTVICSLCCRHFAKDRIEKHELICQKVNQKKRKIFDASKMRIQGTEAENFIKRGVTKKDEPMKKKSNWRAQHESFLESIRQAKKVQKHLAAGGKLSDLPPPKPSENPDYVQCPHCHRKFNPAAADRHIPKCKNIVSNKPRRK